MLSSDLHQLENEHPDYIQRVGKNYWWNFIALVLDSSCFAFTLAMLSQDTILPYFVSRLTDNQFYVGLIPSLFFLGYFLPQILGAYLINGKTTRKWTIFWIAVVERLGILAIAVVAQMLGVLSNHTALSLLLISYTVFTFTLGMIMPAYSDFISKNIIRRRGIFYGMMNGVGGLIGFGASLLARNVLDARPFPDDLRILLWVGFAFSFISPFFIASFREIPFPISPKKESLSTFIKNIPSAVKLAPGFQKFIITRALFGFGLLANSFYFIYAIENFQLREGVLGIFTMIILITQSFLGFVWGWIGDQFGFKKVYIVASLMMIVMGILSTSSPGVWAFYIIAFCIGGLYSAYRISDANMVFEIVSPTQTGRFIGILNTFIAPFMMLAPLVGGLILSNYSHKVLFSTVLVIGFLSTIVVSLFMPNPRHRTASKN
jgi:MFS family permease